MMRCIAVLEKYSGIEHDGIMNSLFARRQKAHTLYTSD